MAEMGAKITDAESRVQAAEAKGIGSVGLNTEGKNGEATTTTSSKPATKHTKSHQPKKNKN